MVKQKKSGKNRKKRRLKVTSKTAEIGKMEDPEIIDFEVLDNQTQILYEIHAELDKLLNLIGVMAHENSRTTEAN